MFWMPEMLSWRTVGKICTSDCSLCSQQGRVLKERKILHPAFAWGFFLYLLLAQSSGPDFFFQSEILWSGPQMLGGMKANIFKSVCLGCPGSGTSETVSVLLYRRIRPQVLKYRRNISKAWPVPYGTTHFTESFKKSRNLQGGDCFPFVVGEQLQKCWNLANASMDHWAVKDIAG